MVTLIMKHREGWINALLKENNEKKMLELRQMLIDFIDIVEQTREEEIVLKMLNILDSYKRGR